MKKSSLLILLMPLVFSSCSNNNSSSTSEQPVWKYSSVMHWIEQDGQIINRGTHRFGDWVIDKPATCIEDGNQYLECSVCSYKKEETIRKTGHNYGSWVSEGEESYRTCSNCGDIQRAVRKQTISINNPLEGQQIDLTLPVIRDLLDHKDDDEYVATHHMNHRYHSEANNYDYQTYVNVNFTDSITRDVSYEIKVATDPEFNNIVDNVITSSNQTSIDGILIPGKTYYYMVESSDGDYSNVDYFTTLNSPVRFITAGGVRNVRDIGGWTAEKGKKVKYGLIYRGASVDASGPSYLNAKAKDIFKKLGMRGQLDLREGMSSYNAWNATYPYLNVNGGWYSQVYDSKTPEKNAALKLSLEFLANSNNYPAYFHCAQGMDRTGTLSYILLGLLGVSENDLYIEYELTDYCCMASGSSHCERAVIREIEQGRYTFNYYANSYPDGTALRTPVYSCLQYIKIYIPPLHYKEV